MKKIIRFSEVIQIVPLCRATIYKLMKEGDFPPKISLGPRAVGWIEQDVIEWVKSRVEEA